jgi:hypothetical protein
MMKKGFAAIIIVLVVSAFVVSTTLSVSLLSIREANASLSNAKGQEALKMTEGCVEEALYRLRIDSTYTGGTLTFANGSCTSTISTSGANRTINVTGTITGPPVHSRSLQIQAKIVGKTINVLNWTEI